MEFSEFNKKKKKKRKIVFWLRSDLWRNVLFWVFISLSLSLSWIKVIAFIPISENPVIKNDIKIQTCLEPFFFPHLFLKPEFLGFFYFYFFCPNC